MDQSVTDKSATDSPSQIELEENTNNQELVKKSLTYITKNLSTIFIISLEDLNKKIFAILKLLATLYLITLFIVLGYHTFKQDNSLEILTFSISDNMGTGITGESLSDNLRFELKKIHQINELNISEVQSPNAKAPINSQDSISDTSHNISTTFSSSNSDSTDEMLDNQELSLTGKLESPQNIELNTADPHTSNDHVVEDLDTFNIEGMSIPLGHLLLTMKELLGNSKNIITSGFYRTGHNLVMVSILEGPKESMVWKVERTLSTENLTDIKEIHAMIKDLSFQISYDLSRGETRNISKTWEAFKYNTLAKEAYKNYYITKNITYLCKACNMTLAAKLSEPSTSTIYSLDSLAPILNNKGVFLSGQGRYDEAVQVFDRAIEIQKASEEIKSIGCILTWKNNEK